MSSTRTLISALRCFICRRFCLGSSVSGSRLLPSGRLSSKRLHYCGRQERAFSRWPVRLESAGLQNSQGDAGEHDNDPTSTENSPEIHKDQFRDAVAIPWYLQIQEQNSQQRPESNAFVERQRIPDLPDNAPPILESLLKHISIDLGLDYLSLIDLRHLDPPPALGGNLIMILGTARSEKHLNVSADRLCRWLRSNYNLTPFADGLLGRNEMKLKQRRKVRRFRMLSAVGANESSNRDDGMSTGWVCVNVGIVEDGTNTTQNGDSAEKQTFVGFGRQKEGAKLVVQMMTEAKREEVDLEGLWQGIVVRAARKQSYNRDAQEEALLEPENESPSANVLQEERFSTATRKSINDRTLSNGAFVANAARPYPSQHVRSFYTACERRNADDLSHSARDAEVFDESDLEPRLLSRSNGPYQPLELIYTETRGERHAPHVDDPTESGSAFVKAFTLRTQLNYLRNLSRAAALEALGEGQQDFSTTSFLSSFYQNIPAFAESAHWDCIIELQCQGLNLEHPKYSKLHLMNKFAEMAASGVEMSERTFLTVFETILLAPHRTDETTKKPGFMDAIHALRRSLGWAFKVLEMMEVHGHDVQTETVFTILHRAFINPLFAAPLRPVTGTTADAGPRLAPALPPRELERYQHFFRKALQALYTPTSDTLFMSMLRNYIVQDDWAAFWGVWRHMARLMRPRPPEMYALMFRGVAQTGHEAHCQKVLAEHVLEMAREKPVVELKGEVAAAVAECLFAAKVPMYRGTWRSLWESCEKVMLAESGLKSKRRRA